ncbi:MAG: complexin-2 [Clostridia bacterium]|nr:complexin-2 [Clostridia bacterium]
MKTVQISKELFFNLIRFHFAEMYEVEEDIKNELQKKLNSMLMREYYTTYKTAPTEQEREESRKKYLDERGVPESFRW